MTFLLLPSPLLPPWVYRPLAEALARAGAPARVAEVGDPCSPEAVVREWRHTVATEPPGVLVAHSNAGLLAPLVRPAAPAPAVPTVFLDAALLPESGRTRLAPASLREHLARLADDQGFLPPWTRWWPPGALDGVVPPDLLGTLDRDCPRLPLAYFDHEVSAPPGWAAAPGAYLALGETYRTETDMARRLGWPTRVEPSGTHLHFLREPDRVAEGILTLARLITAEPSPPARA